ncbi:HgcAB-associated protein HgcC [Candidatus Bipolaricaulota bacterium]
MTEREEEQKGEASCECYKVQALISVDERGQMVLPKDVRKRAGIEGREKLALTTIEKDGKICCILLTKADELVQVVQSTLGEFTQNQNTQT